RQAGGRLRDAGLGLRVGRGLRQALATCAFVGSPQPDRGPHRLLARRVHLGGTRNGDGGGMSATQERTAVDAVPTQLFIGGEGREATGGATLDVEDPSTGETIASVADATPDDAKAALDAACAVQDEGAAHPPRERGAILSRA